jgi:ABC-type xylose transport system substrate-binding protein
MKHFLLSICFVCFYFVASAQNTDSLAYQQQRKIINGLLDKRSRKFNQYQQSLATKTGIFGWQTKKDIRRSGEILMDIAQTDNVIFKQLKILLDYKTFAQTQVVAKSTESETQVVAYMKTINKLREQNDKLQQEQAKETDSYRKTKTTYLIAILALIAVSIFLLLTRKPKGRA